MPNCYYYDEQSDHCNCYVDENLNELLEENVNLRVQLANTMVTVRRVDERCAKLRELVKAMTPFLCCMPFASCNTLAASVRKRMRELGIEVDE